MIRGPCGSFSLFFGGVLSQIKVILFDIYSEESCRHAGRKKKGGVEIYAAAFISHLECLIKFRLHREAIKAGK